MSQDFGKVKHIAALVKPGLVYAADAGPFGGVLSAVDFGGAEIVLSKGTGATRVRASWLDTPADDARSTTRWPRSAPTAWPRSSSRRARRRCPRASSTRTGCCAPTSSRSRRSGRSPKDTPPVLVDWLPWNHTFGGNHNFNLILKRGGTLYIDAGRPAPPLIPITVRNLTEIAPTIYFNVPAGYGALLPFLERDADAARALLRAPGPDLLRRRRAAAGPVDAAGERRARGARRAGDDDLLVGADRDVAAGHRGALPDRPRGRDRRARARAWRSSSTPVEDKLEMRVKGPNVTPGYLGQPELTRQGVRRGRLVPHGRRRQARGPGRPEPGPRVRRARGRGLQAADRHVRVRRQPADRGARRRLAAADGRRRLRARPRLRRRCSRG